MNVQNILKVWEISQGIIIATATTQAHAHAYTELIQEEAVCWKTKRFVIHTFNVCLRAGEGGGEREKALGGGCEIVYLLPLKLSVVQSSRIQNTLWLYSLKKFLCVSVVCVCVCVCVCVVKVYRGWDMPLSFGQLWRHLVFPACLLQWTKRARGVLNMFWGSCLFAYSP